jgi:hypothetical protein
MLSESDLREHLTMLCPVGKWEDFPVASIFVAFDESESQGDEMPAVCVGGFLASGFRWERFGKRWNRILEREGVEVFHACDLETEKAREEKPDSPYKGWDSERVKKFQNDLLDAMSVNMYSDIGVGMTRGVYDQVMTDDRQQRYGDIFTVCAITAMMQAILFSIRHFGVAPSFIVEKGPCAGRLENAYDRLCELPTLAKYLEDTSFAKQPKSSAFPQLQAADYLVFNFSKGISHLFDFDLNPSTSPRIHEGKEIRALRYPLQKIYQMFGDFHIARMNAEQLDTMIRLLDGEAGI